MKNSKISNLKIFSIGVLSGAIILTGSGMYKEYSKKQQELEKFNDKFGTPNLSSSINLTEKVTENQYSFDYYGEEITIQSEGLKVYGFDKNGNIYEEKLKQVEVEKESNQLIPNDFVTALEYNVFSNIQNKDNINTQYNVFQLFENMNKLYEEYLTREDFEGKTERMEYLYDVCVQYIYPDSKYTFGKHKFSELEQPIQNDIKEEILKMKYIKENGSIKEESTMSKISDNMGKILNYKIFKTGK